MKKLPLGNPTLYANDIDMLLREGFYQEWMNEGDWEEFLCELNKNGVTYKLLSEQIDAGIINGHTLEHQINICREYIKNNFSNE